MPYQMGYTRKFASSIIAVLGCQDRVIFKGYLPFADEAHLNRFIDHSLRIKRKDFLAFAEEKAEFLVTHAKSFAAPGMRVSASVGVGQAFQPDSSKLSDIPGSPNSRGLRRDLLDLDDAVLAHAGEVPAVGAEGHLADLLRVPFQSRTGTSPSLP